MKNIIFSTLAITLTACGGGGGGGNSGNDPVTNNPVVTPSINTEHLESIKGLFARNRSIGGAGVTVAVMDSGVNVNHTEFSGKTLNPNSGSFESAALHYTLDEIEERNLTGLELYQPVATGPQEDVNGHGTHVTSMIWGENVGVAPEADLLMLDIYKTNSPDSLAAKGLIESLASQSVDFINASLTGVDYYENNEFNNERPLYSELVNADMGFVVAAGNFGLDMTETFLTNPVDCAALSQADRDESITCRFIFSTEDTTLLAKDADLSNQFLWVGAMDNDFAPSVFQLADGTIVGTNVPGADSDIQARWITAPGTLVEGAFFGNDTDYLKVSGTSQAAPLVTGAAALVKGQFPTLSNAAVLQVLLDTADNTFEAYDPAIYGQGVLDIEAALSIDPSSYAAL